MKFLTIFSWNPDKAKEITERFKKWTPPGDIKFLLPAHTILGANKSVTITETDSSEALAKVTRFWRDLGVMKTYPIMESAEVLKIE